MAETRPHARSCDTPTSTHKLGIHIQERTTRKLLWRFCNLIYSSSEASTQLSCVAMIPLQVQAFVVDNPSTLNAHFNSDLHITAKRYTTAHSAQNPQGVTLLFTHCIGSRTILPYFTRLVIEYSFAQRQGAMGTNHPATLSRTAAKGRCSSHPRSVVFRQTQSRRCCHFEPRGLEGSS